MGMVTSPQKYVMNWQLINLFIAIFVLGIAHEPLMAQSINQDYVYATDWSDDGLRLAISTRQGLSIYNSLFISIAFHDFPADNTFIVPDISLSHDGS